jgi:2-oxoacid:acceptor oxidoreductase gamma subunit (pyruvate/2-ketoisovalerate family)
MIEIRFHGRGGQGAVTAGEMLAQAAFLEGKHPQSFPFFGVERRGAPVAAFCRIGDTPIAVRTAVTTPDIVVVFDAALLRAVPVADGLKAGGLLLVNSEKPAVQVRAPQGARVVTVDATAIALAHGLGSRASPIVNTSMLGGLAGASGVVGLDALLAAIRAALPARAAPNEAAATQAWRAVHAVAEVAA